MYQSAHMGAGPPSSYGTFEPGELAEKIGSRFKDELGSIRRNRRVD